MYKLFRTTAIALVLAGSASAQTSTDDEMRNLTTNVLAGITGTAPESQQPTETTQVETDALRGLVEQAVAEGQSDAYLEALISEAADNGQIEVPDEMRTTSGEVDTKTLLASLVAQSENANGGVDVDILNAEALGEDAVDEQEDRFYKVVAGDSLAAISLQYYGTSDNYIQIFQANRDILNRPNLIVVGQTLLIPR